MSIQVDPSCSSSLHQIKGHRRVHLLWHALWEVALGGGDVGNCRVQCAHADGGCGACALQLGDRCRSCSRSRSPRLQALPQPPPVPMKPAPALSQLPPPPQAPASSTALRPNGCSPTHHRWRMHCANGKSEWKKGDWMCPTCDNHNYASRLQCNRCQRARPED